jgi:hypothetical protein
MLQICDFVIKMLQKCCFLPHGVLHYEQEGCKAAHLGLLYVLRLRVSDHGVVKAAVVLEYGTRCSFDYLLRGLEGLL